jgi:HK97 family phage prohead protease
MKAFFDRHASDSKAKGFRAGEPGFPSNGKIADLLWGGRSGESWCNKVVRQMNAADERTYSPDMETAILEEEAASQRSAEMQGVERRYFGSFDKPDENSLTVEHRADPATGAKRTYIVGYAAKFGTDSLLLGDFIERLAPSAFDIVKAGKDEKGKPLNTRCLFNHDPNHLLGRFPTTMKMTVDKIGLRYECLLPESRKDIAEMISRGDLRGSSFSFVVAEGGEKWSTENGQSIRLVTKIKSLLDCSPVTYPAYDDATVEIAKRSYEVFSSEKKKSVEVRSNVASEIEKTRAFLDERRGFCPTGPGGGIDNSCGGSASGSDQMKIAKEALDKYEAGRKTTSGKIADAAATGAIIGGTVGLVGGAAGAVVGSITGALLGLAGRGAAAAIGSIASGRLDSLAKSIGVSQDKLSSASSTLFGSDSKPFALDSKTIAIESGDNIALISSGSQFSKASGTAFHFQPGSDVNGTLDIKAVEKAARATGAKVVSAEVWSDKDAKSLTSKGYRQVVSSPGGFSKSKGIYEKNLSGGKYKRSYDELMNFYHSRGFCPTGSGGGVDNSCGAKELSSPDKDGTGGGSYQAPKSLEQQRLEAAGTFQKPQEKTLNEKVDDMKDYLRKSGHGWADFAKKAQAHAPDRIRNATHAKNHAAHVFATQGAAGFDTYLTEIGMRSSRGFCPTGSGGGVDNSCGGGKYMEWSKGKDKEAQDFIDKARKDQTIAAGKDGGKSDDGGGVQTWSKGDHFPWTVKQVGDTEGHVQGQHPDGSKTEKNPFSGGKTSDALKKVSDEIKRRKSSRADQVVADTLKFLKDRRA